MFDIEFIKRILHVLRHLNSLKELILLNTSRLSQEYISSSVEQLLPHFNSWKTLKKLVIDIGDNCKFIRNSETFEFERI